LGEPAATGNRLNQKAKGKYQKAKGKMKNHYLRFVILLVVVTGVVIISSFISWARGPREVKFQKFTLDKEFRSEGVAVADVNGDGKMDVLAGNLWYEAPDWKAHEIAPPKQFDAAKGYSNSFVNYAMDVNGDGWADQILIGWPGQDPVVWRENPKTGSGPWAVHPIARNACNESPAFAHLSLTEELSSGGLHGFLTDTWSRRTKEGRKKAKVNPNEKPVLIFSLDEAQMGWFEPGADLNAEFKMHPISLKSSKQSAKADGVAKYSHGLGVGDINGDGRNDVLVTAGYWQGPPDPRTSTGWNFVKADFGEDCAQMLVYDVNDDGLNDVITSSAHKIGIWWFEQKRSGDTITFVKHEIDNSIAQTHSIVLADINGDGKMDFVTGKRYWAHGPTGDVNPDAPAVVVWFELQRKKGEVTWTKHEIDNDSGVGTQFTVADMNNDKRPDVITANKKGVYVFLQTK
jgi:hypothetical protein